MTITEEAMLATASILSEAEPTRRWSECMALAEEILGVVTPMFGVPCAGAADGSDHDAPWDRARVVEAILALGRERLGGAASPLDRASDPDLDGCRTVDVPAALREQLLRHFRDIERHSLAGHVVEMPLQGVRVVKTQADGKVTYLLGTVFGDDDEPRVAIWDLDLPLRERPVGVSELVDEVCMLCGLLSALGQLVGFAGDDEGLLRGLRLRMGLVHGVACDLVRAARNREAGEADHGAGGRDGDADGVHGAIEAGRVVARVAGGAA